MTLHRLLPTARMQQRGLTSRISKASKIPRFDNVYKKIKQIRWSEDERQKVCHGIPYYTACNSVMASMECHERLEPLRSAYRRRNSTYWSQYIYNIDSTARAAFLWWIFSRNEQIHVYFANNTVTAESVIGSQSPAASLSATTRCHS